MDDSEKSGTSTQSRSPSLAQNFLPPRLTYTPVNEGVDGIGELERNNALVSRFQQLSEFRTHVSASSAPHRLAGRPVDINRSNQNWLIKSYPDAFVGDAGFTSLLADEISSLRAPAEPVSASSCLLSIGEIADLRIPREPAGYLVLASATGDFGHILRLAILENEEWGWDEQSGVDNLSVRLKNVDLKRQTEWFDDAEPIISIKFVAYIRNNQAIRWVVVQKASSTAILQPELRNPPQFDEEIAASNVAGRGSCRIFANLICSIPRDETGGSPQCDSSFNPISELDNPMPPQLAIIDQAGNWSVWDLGGQLQTQSPSINAVLHHRGNILGDPLNNVASRPQVDHSIHSIMWLAQPPTSRMHEAAALDPDLLRDKYPLPLRRSSVLVLCNNHTLDIFDLNSGHLIQAINLVSPTKTQRILQMQPCPLELSQFLILTNKAFLWVESIPARDGRTSLEVALSRTHHMETNQGSLQLGVSPVFEQKDKASVLVFIYSTRETQMMIHRLTRTHSSNIAQCHSQILDLGHLINPISITITPAPRKILRKRISSQKLGRLVSRNKVILCQVVALAPDLSISSALFAWSEQPDSHIPFPYRKTQAESDTNPQHHPNTFLVPDCAGDGILVDKLDPTPTAKEIPFRPKKPSPLGFPVSIISQKVNMAIDPSEASQESSLPAVEDRLRGVIDGSLPAHTLLDAAGGSDSNHTVIAKLAREWASLQDSTNLAQLEVNIGRPGAWIPELDYDSGKSYWAINWAPAEVERQCERTLDHIKTQLSLSQVRISSIQGTPGHISKPQNPQSEGLFSSQQLPTPEPQLKPGDQKDSQASGTEEDPLASRLRQYIPTLKEVPRRPGGKALPISHWDLGGDPDKTRWKDPETQKEDEEAVSRRRKREEAMQRKAMRSVSVLSQQSDGLVSSPYPQTQPLPQFFLSSQLNSQPPPSSSIDGHAFSQPLSQIVPGPFGGRRSRSKTPAKPQGFR